MGQEEIRATFKCPRCNQTIKVKNQAQHKQTCICRAELSQQENLINEFDKRVREVRAERKAEHTLPTVCNECQQEFSYHWALIRHIETAHCHKKLSEALRKAEAEGNVESTSGKDIRYCREEVKKFNRRDRYCNVCDKEFKYHRDLVKHLNNSQCHKRRMVPRKQSAFNKRLWIRCSFCGQEYTAQSENQHILSQRHLKAIGEFNAFQFKEYALRKNAGHLPNNLNMRKCKVCKKLVPKKDMEKHGSIHIAPRDIHAEILKWVDEWKKENSVKDLPGKSEDRDFTAKRFKEFLKWREISGWSFNTSVADMLGKIAGPIPISFAEKITERKKAFQGWASAVEPPKEPEYIIID